jgi:hypothetical protein
MNEIGVNILHRQQKKGAHVDVKRQWNENKDPHYWDHQDCYFFGIAQL